MYYMYVLFNIEIFIDFSKQIRTENKHKENQYIIKLFACKNK